MNIAAPSIKDTLKRLHLFPRWLAGRIASRDSASYRELVRTLLRADNLAELRREIERGNGRDVLRDVAGEFIASGAVEGGLAGRRLLVERFPDDAGLRLDLFRDLVRVDRSGEARALVGPSDINLVRDIGGEFFRAGLSEQGLACRRLAVELQPHSTMARTELVRDLWALRDKAEAYDEAAKIDFRGMEPADPVKYHDFTPAERTIFIEVRDLVIAKPEAVISLLRAVDYIVDNNIPGAFVECGVFKGGNIVAMLRALLERGRADRDVYLFDTFEGMPFPDEVDVFYTGERAIDEWKDKRHADGSSTWVNSPLEATQANVRAVKEYPAERLFFVKGLVEETLPAEAPDQIALLRLDTDFYRSTKHELVHLYPRLAPGGILIIDDYGAFLGARKATDEYFHEQGIPIFLARIDEHVRLAVKRLSRDPAHTHRTSSAPR